MERKKKLTRKSKPGPQKESGPWRPTIRQVLWAIGTLATLLTIALLVVQLYPGLWEDVSKEPVAMLKGRVATLIGIGVALTVLITLLAMGSASLGWTGFRGKTLWDLLQLFIVPLVLVSIGLLFEMQQAAREEARAETERALAEERAQDEALQAYLDQMGSLLLEKDLRVSEEDSEVRTLARARTLTVLERLDPKRKRALMQFLVEAKLVQRVGERPPLIALGGANLSGTNLSGIELIGAELSFANLRAAELSYANLNHANLTLAELIGAELRYADLRGAIVDGANLTNANLRGADLSEAHLSGAEGVTKERLKQQAKSLRRTTMPDGTILYATSEFDPALSFILSGAPQVGFNNSLRAEVETTGTLFIEDLEGGSLIFTTPSYVFDLSNPSEPKVLPAPANATEWVSWFQRHPNLDTSKPVPVSVGGASGVRIDVRGTSPLENHPREVCGVEPCVPLYRGSTNESMIVSYDSRKDRFVIVDVGGETVIIDVSAPEDKFDALSQKAQEVLDTVEWRDG